MLDKNSFMDFGFSSGMSEALIPAFGKKLLPNPTVGAALINQRGQLVISASHEGKGTDHAESIIIKKITERQIDTRNCSLFVTLEPCMHEDTSPSCAKLITESGLFNNVVIGDIDPDERTKRSGVLYLQNNGITVDIEKGATSFIDPSYMSYAKNVNPYLISKFGVSKDWSTFSSKNKNKYITSEHSRKLGHVLRASVDAILIGKKTLITDKPKLNIRYNLNAPDPFGVVLWGSILDSANFLYYFNKYKNFKFICSYDKKFAEAGIYSKNNQRIIFIKGNKITASKILDSFHELNINSCLLEGGLLTWKLFDSASFKSIKNNKNYNTLINKMHIFESSIEFENVENNSLDKQYVNKKYTLLNKINYSEDSLYIYERKNL